MTFWDGVVIVGIVVLIVAVIEVYEKWRAVMFPDARNHHQDERERQIDSLRLAARFPPAKGPKGFDASEVFQPDRKARVQPIRKERVQ